MSVINPAASPAPIAPTALHSRLSPSPTLNQAGMFTGDGMGPLPANIVTKILSLELEDLSLLLFVDHAGYSSSYPTPPDSSGQLHQ